MLVILRNNASHADGLNRDFEHPNFVKPKKDFYTYKTIKIDSSKKSEWIEYNNLQLLELFDDMFTYIEENIEIFITNHLGEPILDLMPVGIYVKN